MRVVCNNANNRLQKQIASHALAVDVTNIITSSHVAVAFVRVCLYAKWWL